MAGLALLAAFFYWIPLTSANATPQWDAIDVHYSSQKYFADRVRAGELPYWTPYIFCGFPFLADPQVGAWYPLNWPFYLVGITPKAIQAELAVHALLAAWGGFLLALCYVQSRAAALLGAMFYAFSGYFADHSQHVGIFSAASWLPWLLWFVHRSLEGPWLKWTAAAGLTGGAMILAGHFQTALYSFCAVVLYAAGLAVSRRGAAARLAVFAACAILLAVLLSGIQTLPGLELAGLSVRAGSDYSASTERVLRPGALANLVWPNSMGLFSLPENATPGPEAYYLYGGLLLVPLAVLGLSDRAGRIAGLALIIVPAWYMFGPAWGLYRLGAIVPGLHRVRAPIHGWFVAALGLAILAALGAAWLFERTSRRHSVRLGLAALVFLDLFCWNSWQNPAAYARYSFDERYGNAEALAREKVASSQPPLSRYHAPERLTVFGPLNHPLDLRLEATYGYNPLELSRYRQYFQAALDNPRLLGGMNVSRILDVKLGAVVPFGETLPRAWFARDIEYAADDAGSLARLRSHDPARVTLANEPVDRNRADPEATVTISSFSEQAYRLRYRASKTSLLRMSVPYYPGWTAAVGGVPRRVLRVDHAFLGVEVPPGENELTLVYRPRYFPAGAAVSAFALVASALLLSIRKRHAASR